MKQKPTSRIWIRLKVLLVVFAAAILIGQALSAQHKLKPGFNLFSKEQDVQLGKESASQMEKQMQVVNDSDLENYLNSITKRLIAVPDTDAQSFQYSFPGKIGKKNLSGTISPTS